MREFTCRDIKLAFVVWLNFDYDITIGTWPNH